MNETMKDAILLCVVAYVIWIILLTLWRKVVSWWKKRFRKTRYTLKDPRRELTIEQILGKSKFKVQFRVESPLFKNPIKKGSHQAYLNPNMSEAKK